MKNKIDVALMVVTFGCWVAAIVDTVCCIIDPQLSIVDSWIAWAVYMIAQIIKGVIDGSFKEWAKIMGSLICLTKEVNQNRKLLKEYKKDFL